MPSLNQPFYRDDHLFVNLRLQLAILDGETITLTRIQYRLLALLVEYAGEPVPRATILTQIWGYAPEMDPQRVAGHIRALRRKLGVYGGLYIETVIGVGYRFRPLPAP